MGSLPLAWAFLLAERSLHNAIAVRLRQNIGGEARKVGGGHQHLLVMENLVQQVSAALEIELAKHIVEQKNRLLAGYSAHIGELGQLGRQGHRALLAA